jgi:hypothetical protein
MTPHAGTLGLLLLAACGATDGGEPDFGPAEVVSSGTTTGATPSILIGAGGERMVSWVAELPDSSRSALFVQVSGGGRSGGGSGVLTDSLGSIEPHGEAPPQLAAGPKSTLFAAYVVGREVPGLRFPKSSLRFARSEDGGITWSAPVTINEGEQFGSHNFHSVLAGSGGLVVVAWLSSGGTESKVMLRQSPDGGRNWEPTVTLHESPSCPCCRTALALAPDGTMYATWRKIFPGDVRDVVVARSDDGGKTWGEPVRPRADDWVYPGCPHAGPSLRVDEAGRVHVAWWTGKAGEAGVYYARSEDGGRSFAAQAIATGKTSRPAHVHLATRDGRVLYAWDDGRGALPGILLRTSSDAGVTFDEPVRLSESGLAASYPVAALTADSVFVAWSQLTRAAHHASQAARPDMNNPDATMPLPKVGQSRIVLRGRAVGR